jgi:hypothetical protein
LNVGEEHLQRQRPHQDVGVVVATIGAAAGLAGGDHSVGDGSSLRCEATTVCAGGEERAASDGRENGKRAGDARTLWHSIQRILALPDGTRLFTGHDYRPGDRAAMWESTVAEQKSANAHVRDYDEEAFVRIRTERDAALPMPELMLAALQVNIAAGRLPAPEIKDRRYLKIQLDAFPGVCWE